MKILHIVEDFSVKSGGLRSAIYSLDDHLKKDGFQSYILSSEKEKEDTIYTVPATNKWLYHKDWINKIDSIVSEKKIDIIHIHGVWLYPQYIGAKYAVKNNIPFVFSCHGMYQPWLWKKGTLKKKLYLHFLSKKWFRKAKVIHTITENETKNTRKFFKKAQFIEIPNLVSFSTTEAVPDFSDKYILYLGRLNKTKGIDVLITAFANIVDKKVTLKIAGGFNDYKKELETLVKTYKLGERVEFLGEVKGTIKEKLIQNAWAMVSPTFSDVIGIVNLEAGLFKTPMITTYKTGLKNAWNSNGGFLIEPTISELEKALTEVVNYTIEKRIAKGEQLHAFVKENYSWEQQFPKWKDLYELTLKS
ncbi:glycosyltransferase [Tenacibaculum amylolyticum]|uniref:glycosyltransferase n=1 Tax=Tenacibaculum amylolyticum TaxID=104269 RepID=UPI003895E35A